MHVWTEEVTSVAAASNVVVRIYFGSTTAPHHFHVSAVPTGIEHPYTVSRYAILPSSHILVRLEQPPAKQTASLLALESVDAQHCRELVLAKSRLATAVKAMSTTARGKKGLEEAMDGDDSD